MHHAHACTHPSHSDDTPPPSHALHPLAGTPHTPTTPLLLPMPYTRPLTLPTSLLLPERCKKGEPGSNSMTQLLYYVYYGSTGERGMHPLELDTYEITKAWVIIQKK